MNTPSRQTAPSTIGRLRSSAHFPRDLRVWLRHSALLRAAQGLAQETDLCAVQPIFTASAKRFQHPWRMLTLITYACAVGVIDDSAIAALAAVEPDLYDLCRGEAPSANAIRRFRNQNRNVITGCVGKLLRHVWFHQNTPDKAALNPMLAIEILCEARSRVQELDSGGDPVTD